jgi:hypothetical protein
MLENYKIKVKDEAESKEAQELFFKLGYGWNNSSLGGKTGIKYTDEPALYATATSLSFCGDMDHFHKFNAKELTLPQLRDLVVLKRNDVKDANYKLFISPSQGYLSLYKASDDVFYAYASKSKCWGKSRAVDVNTKDLEPIFEEKDPALISGAEAFTYLISGRNDVQTKLNDTEKWRDVPTGMSWAAFANPDRKFRLEPQTIKLELELPKPFEPKDGDTFYFLSDGEECGFVKCEHDWTFDPKELNFGAYRSEEEIKQVVDQLRKIRGV